MPLARMSPPFALPRTVPLFSAVTPATLSVPLTAARFRLLEIVPLFFAAMPAVPLPPRSVPSVVQLLIVPVLTDVRMALSLLPMILPETVRFWIVPSMYENKYPLLSALSRPLLASKLVDIAHQYDAKYVAHGCTGKGNDQVRFEASILTLDPDLEVIAPVREWDLKSRPDEVAYAHEHGVPVPEGANDHPYSIDDNLWGRAIECGVLEDPWNEPPHDVWVMTKDPEETPDTPTYVDVDFEKGVPVALDGEKMPLAALVEKLNQVAGDNGYGRLDLMENRMVGLKSRECYEVPAALTLITAHKALEDLTLERDVLHQKLYLEQTWATCVYNGQWFSPLKKALDAFMAETQKFVTGTVRLKFFKGHCTVMGRKSPCSLYDYGLATYDRDTTFDEKAAVGFIEIETLSLKTWAKMQGPTSLAAQSLS